MENKILIISIISAVLCFDATNAMHIPEKSRNDESKTKRRMTTTFPKKDGNITKVLIMSLPTEEHDVKKTCIAMLLEKDPLSKQEMFEKLMAMKDKIVIKRKELRDSKEKRTNLIEKLSNLDVKIQNIEDSIRQQKDKVIELNRAIDKKSNSFNEELTPVVEQMFQLEDLKKYMIKLNDDYLKQCLMEENLSLSYNSLCSEYDSLLEKYKKLPVSTEN